MLGPYACGTENGSEYGRKEEILSLAIFGNPSKALISTWLHRQLDPLRADNYFFKGRMLANQPLWDSCHGHFNHLDTVVLLRRGVGDESPQLRPSIECRGHTQRGSS